MKKYLIGQISIDEDGNFWCEWYGTSYNQGGPSFGPTNMGLDVAEGLLKIVGKDLDKNKEEYMRMVEEKSDSLGPGS